MKMDDLHLAYSDLTESVYIKSKNEKKDITNEFYAVVVWWLQNQNKEDLIREISEHEKNPYWKHIISMKSKLCWKDETK